MSDSPAKITPAMQRYLEVKAQHPGTLVLFRIGDFYELFYEDAQAAARVLGLTLTSRDKGSSHPVPMAGFPYHQLDNYLRRLIAAGLRAAICDQVEDAAQAKGLVKREVTRIVTPGTVTDDALLDPRQSNYLASIYPDKAGVGLAWIELSTGRFIASDLPLDSLADELARLQPAESLVPERAEAAVRLMASGAPADWPLTTRPDWCYVGTAAQQALLEHFGTRTLEAFGWNAISPGVIAAGALLEYLRETQRGSLPHIVRLEQYERGGCLLIDEATRRSLELTRTLRDGTREGSLLAIIDETVTPMGARLLADWLGNPLLDIARINARLDAVEELVAEPTLTQDLQTSLRSAYDLQRLTARVATGRATPRDLRCLSNTLQLLPKIKARLTARRSPLLGQLESELDLCGDVFRDIEALLVDDPPLALTDGGLIRPGCHPQLDELRDLARGGKEWMVRYQGQEAARTGIPGLKVGFNKVFGYYLEITAAQAARAAIPPEYIRKQTLKNQERFITPELKQHEEKVLRAESQSEQLEIELFCQLRDRIATQGARLKQTAEALAQLDVLAGLATLAIRCNYRRPLLTADPVLEIHEGRHPVLDRIQPSGQFVPNDTLLGPEAGLVQIITGPNMAGKSTYIRQTALLTILSQIGSFVPAREARIGIADRIFARVGASDELGKGQSTFMVEMTETARILHAATSRSLVILDEIGRGTSTYDGISLAWSVTEYLHDAIGCRTMFATHYHELTELTTTLTQARNWNVAVHEDGAEGIVFLHRIVPGAADKSYGIHVARLAGVPSAVIERARVILDTLEAEHVDAEGRPKVPPRATRRSAHKQLRLFPAEEHPLLDSLRQLDVDQLTPLQALQKLHQLREELAAGQP